MKRVLTDNMKAVAGLYIMYAEELKAYFCSYARNTNIANALQYAEDMTHDLYLKVMELDMINNQTAKSLLFVMAHRMVIDDVRHHSFVRHYMENAIEELSKTDAYRVEDRMDADYLSQVERCQMACMPEKSARIYQLYFHEDYSAKDIAVELGMNRRTVEGCIYRCRKEMRERFRKVM